VDGDEGQGFGKHFALARLAVTSCLPFFLCSRFFASVSRASQIILGIAAVISLALGIYQSVGVEHEPIFPPEGGCTDPNGCTVPSIEWVEGVAILIAVLIVVLVGSVNDWQKERQFKKLNEKKDDRQINCIRGGVRMSINTKDILVGDICVVETGEILPVDGVFLRGHNVKCDESGATGESDLIKKATYEECIEERNSLPPGKALKKDCFLISGAKVTEGVGEYVVIAVGTKSFNGRLMMGEPSVATTFVCCLLIYTCRSSQPSEPRPSLLLCK